MVWAVTLLTTELGPRRLTPEIVDKVFEVWLDSAIRWDPVVHSALYPFIVVSLGEP